MNTDCERFSPAAQAIYEKIKGHFPPDSWNKPQWTPEGIVIHNKGNTKDQSENRKDDTDSGTFDLKRGADRQRLMSRLQCHIGYIVTVIDCASARGGDGSVADVLSQRTYCPLIHKHADLYLLLSALSLQIETMDHIDGGCTESNRGRTETTNTNCPNCNNSGYNGLGPCIECGYTVKAV